MKRLFFIALACFFMSCEKDKTCNQDMGGISGNYKITALGYKANGSATEQDYYNTVFTDACERDDNFTLNANGTLTFVDAGTKCSPAGDFSSTWSVSGSTITIDGDTGTIQSFDCSTMVVIASGFITAGDQLRVTYTRL